jgi:hypothetical protein
LASGDGLARACAARPGAAIDDLIARFDAGVVRRAKDLLEPAGRRMGATLDFLNEKNESD